VLPRNDVLDMMRNFGRRLVELAVFAAIIRSTADLAPQRRVQIIRR
jgi:hypothetical protein